ncbi:hypothetical protein D3C87_1514900 [compost metagenome]
MANIWCMKLSQLLPTLPAAERDSLAQKAGTSAGYLWQLATRWRGKRPSIDLLTKLAAADPRLSVPELVEEFASQKPELSEAKEGA